jgi:hypothetical protein
MSELGDLLELLHESGRFTSVYVEFRTWRHQARSLAAFQAEAEGSGAVMFAQLESDEEPPETTLTSDRLWLDPPRTRLEQGDEHLAVKDGESWWTWHKSWGAQTNVGAGDSVSTSIGDQFMPLLKPATLMGALVWSPLGVGERDGRRTLRASARPRPPRSENDHDLRWGLHAFGSGAEEYIFELDRATGIVLGVEARFGGDAFQVIEVVDLAVDEPIPPDTFVFQAPDGEQPEPFEPIPDRFGMAVTEIIEVASFTVLLPAKVPPSWRLDAHYMPERKRPPMSERVTLFYRSEDATGSLSIGQSRPTSEDDEMLLRGDGWEDFERDGVAFKMRPRTRSWRQPQLYIERDGTAAMLTSDTLTNDELIELALSLGRAGAR